MADLPICGAEGCENRVRFAHYKFCSKHYSAESKSPESPVVETNAKVSNIKFLTTTQLSELLSLSNRKLNQVFSELGWIKKTENGWLPTELGTKLLAEVKTAQNKMSYVVWPQDITKSRILTRAIEEFLNPEKVNQEAALTQSETKDVSDFRTRYPADFRATDGHQVRSRGELNIDNWLYYNKIVHAYERKVPIEEDMFCDFYIPAGNVYIEYWGFENDKKYLERKQHKLELYKKYSLNLIELENKHIENLDDYLPKFLLKYKVKLEPS